MTGDHQVGIVANGGGPALSFRQPPRVHLERSTEIGLADKMKSIALRLAGATVSALAMPTPATNNNSSGANLTFTGPSHFLTPCERNAGRFRSTRKQLVREQSSHVLRVQKTLEDANIKLDSVLADLMGKSGRAMIEALIAGETNPAKLASLADRRVKASAEEFRDALRGRVTKHHRFLLRLHLNQIDALDAAMATIDAQVEENLGPFRTAVEQIISIPGVKNLGAHVIVSEIGIDMSRFPSAAHLISWACIRPRNDQSAGKRRSNRVRKGGTWLKTALVQCAGGKKERQLSAGPILPYQSPARPQKGNHGRRRLYPHRHLPQLKDGTMYKDLGRNHFDRRSSDQQKNRLVKRLADLGYAVEIKPLAVTA